MRALVFLLTLLAGFASSAQKNLTGMITDAASHQPVAGASVFLSNTSVGTTANGRGQFTLSFPAGKYDLVISAIGYETQTRTLAQDALPASLEVALKPKPKEMEAVVIKSFEKNGWKTWGQFFIDNFMGTSAQARRCVLKNKDAVRFRLSDDKSLLTVVAREPLLIENKALGYRIRYQLEEFSFDFSTRVINYTGFPLFEELEAGAAKTRKWDRNRREAYEGSIMHFMRALYRNRLREEGFDVFAQRKLPNVQRIRRKFTEGDATLYDLDNGSRIRCDLPEDSIRNAQKWIGREYVLNLVDSVHLTGDSLAFTTDGKIVTLSFTDYLTVLYSNGKTPDEYRKSVRNGNYAMQSEITLIHGVPVSVEANGSVYGPLDILTNGWWAWSEKIGTMLPFDYQPAADQ